MHAGQVNVVGSLDTWLGQASARCGPGDTGHYGALPLQRTESGPTRVLPAVDPWQHAWVPHVGALSFGDFSSGLCNEASLSHREEGLESRAVDALLFGTSDSEEEDKGEADEILRAYGACRSEHVALPGKVGDEDAGLGLVPTSVSSRYSSLRARRSRGIVSSTGYVLAPTGAAAPFNVSSTSSAHSSTSDCASGTAHGSLGSALSASGMSAPASTSSVEGYFDGLRFADQHDQQQGVGSLDIPPTAAARGMGSSSGSRGSCATIAAGAAAATAAATGALFASGSLLGPLGDSPSATWLLRTAAATAAAAAPQRSSSAAVLTAVSPVSFTAFAPMGCVDGTPQQRALACAAWPRSFSNEGTYGNRGYSASADTPTVETASSALPGAAAAATWPFEPVRAAAGCRTSAKSHGPYESTVRGGTPRRAAGRASPLLASLASPAACNTVLRGPGSSGGGPHVTTAVKRSAPIPVAASRPQSAEETRQHMQQQAKAPPPCLTTSLSQAELQIRGVAPKHLCDMLRNALQRRP